MAGRLTFDDRLLNKYTVEDLETSHPALHAALVRWFAAFGDFDDTSLAKLIAARGPADIQKWQAKGEAALASLPAVVATLDAVIAELKSALNAKFFPERAQLQGLLESAKANRLQLVERAPALVAATVSGAAGYDTAIADASAAVTRAAASLERLLADSGKPGRTFALLEPLVNELKNVWSDLDAALAPLSRQDQEAARRPEAERMHVFAKTFCTNVFDVKMRERAAGTLAPPVIEALGDSAADRFAAAMGRWEFAAAHGELAPWLRSEWTAKRLGEDMTRAARDIARDFELDVAPPPGAYTANRNSLSYESVRTDGFGRDVPADVTAENYAGWYVVEIQTEEGDEYLTDVGTIVSFTLAVVNTSDGERIGHLAIAE